MTHSMVKRTLLLLSFAPLAMPTYAADELSAFDSCLLDAVKNQSGKLTVDAIRKRCQESIEQAPAPTNLVSNRIENERDTAFNPFVITPHRMNYILPVTYTDHINRGAYDKTDWAGHLKNTEAKFQISFKVPLNYDDMFIDGDGLFFAFTMKSYWQVYAGDISRPFRETNYRPELFYFAPTPWQPLGGKTWMTFGIEHQSNGRSQVLSRSWNRIYTNFIYEKDNFALSFQPWYRLPEDDKRYPGDPEGDDNPDIADYMGHFELTTVYKWDDYEFSFLGRQNFSTHKGYGEFGVTFPLWGRLRGYAQYTTGYGDSMIDYNINQNRIGLGVALTDLL
ncbi:phospholipase [Photobacterium damselae]|nr:phospholipase [Photobacterium damselae]MBF7098231.1 phospholipase A [Photobacterium damselae]